MITQLVGRIQAERELHQQQLEAERAKREADARVAQVEAKSTQKGATYESEIDILLHGSCAPYSGEIELTRDGTGLLPNCKKGDWVVAFEESWVPRIVRVVVENEGPKASSIPALRKELGEAMQNRDADAALVVLASRELAPGGKLLTVNPLTRQIVIVHARDEQDNLMLDVGIQLARTLALQHATVQAGTAHGVDIGEMSRLVGEIVGAVDAAKATLTQTNAARRSLDKIDDIYQQLAERAQKACGELTSRLRAA